MTTVPQKTLSWLWNVLGRDYTDPNRTYSDLVQALSLYSSISPRTDVYTYENGTSALLLHLTGTIPVLFRGANYRFPIALWIPHHYPQEGPIVYVTPTEGMIVRPGQHVSGEGKVYHPYLARWTETWNTSNCLELIANLADIFSKEPPVIAKQQTQRQVAQGPTSSPPPIPPSPYRTNRVTDISNPTFSPSPPPPPPPKRHDSPIAREYESPRLGRYDAPPPLPSDRQILEHRRSASGAPYSNGQPALSHPSSQFQPQRTSSLRQSITSSQIQGYPNGSNSSRQHLQQDQSRAQFMDQYGQQRFPTSRPTQRPLSYQGPPNDSQQQSQGPPNLQQSRQQDLKIQPSSRPANGVPGGPSSRTPQSQPKPAVNLLDSPFDVALPVVTNAANLPPPPIPRNPEKEALLQSLSQTLTQHLQSSIGQNMSALPALQAQQSALNSSMSTLEAEIGNITNLNHTIQSNISILQTALRQADGAISDAQSRAKKGDIASVDDLLVVPTIVGKQLYEVVCEARGIEAGIWALQAALVRGRISTDLWARRTRELSRELFAKKMLEKKIGQGLGLTDQ